MKKLLAALLALLLLTGCQKKKTQAEITLPEPEPPAAEETTAEPAEEPEEALPEESSAESEQESVAPDLGNFEELLEVLQTLQTRKDWKNSPEYEIITAQKEKVLSHLPGMPDGGKTNEKRRKKDIGAGFGESYDTDACSVQ